MCGIGVWIERIGKQHTGTSKIVSSSVSSSSTDNVQGELLSRRGPHSCQSVTVRSLRTTSKSHNDDDADRMIQTSTRITSTVLHMRGDEMTPQPVQVADDTYFCWNGEVYELLPVLQMDERLADNESDTRLLARLLKHELAKSTTTTTDAVSVQLLDAVSSVLARVVNGEFAFVLATPDFVVYGRDAWGRRSLLDRISPVNDKSSCHPTLFQLSSVATTSSTTTTAVDCWTEVPPGQLFLFDCKIGKRTSRPLLTLQRPQWMESVSPTCSEVMPKQLHPACSERMWQASLQLERVLLEAVRCRLQCCRSPQEPTAVAILFSGGLDSVVLAALAAQVVPHLDLLNVAFGDTVEQSADRQAAIQSHDELKVLYPSCTFSLVCVNVSWESVQEHEAHIKKLIAPKTTLMDLNIGTALWFASRGRGVVERISKDDDESSPHQQTVVDDYTSTCRILLVGMGADEQMAGYGRHRNAYQKGGNEQLRRELDLDMGRLWERNLGRDDRLLSDHGKEARFPFLDARVVDLIRGLPLDCVCDMDLPAGIGDKQILRLMAQRLGLSTASGLVKRAIQFGSRIAHVSDKQRFGSRRKAKGTLQC